MPDWSPHIRARLSALRLSPTRAAEIADELAQHLDDRYRDAIAGGATEDEALRAALAQFGERDRFAAGMVALRQARQADPLPVNSVASPIAGFLLDLRHAARGLRKDCGVAIAAVMTLAIGIGANAALFSVVNAVLLRPLPVDAASRIVNVWLLRDGRPNWHFRVPAADADLIRRDNRVFEAMARYESETRDLTGRGEPEEVSVGLISADLPALLGARPVIGRTFDSRDEEPGRGDVVLISDGLWRRRFAANPAVIGSDLSLDGRSYRVVGVMPPGFRFPAGTDIWRPIDRSGHVNAFILAKLRPDATVEQARADMTLMIAAITNGRPRPGMRFDVEALKDTVVGNAKASWLLLLGAVACVLAIGCANVGNLMLARGLRRQREIDIRLALGASRARIVRLLFAEGLLVSILGCAIALAVAFWGITALRAWAPIDTPRLDEIRVEPMLLWVAMTLAAVTTLAVGLIPALQLSRTAVNARLTTSGVSAATTPAHTRARDLIVVVQVGMALVLLVSASLLARSLVHLSNVNPGYDVARLLTVNLHLASPRYHEPAQRTSFVGRVLDDIRGMPGVAAASAASGSIMKGWGLIDSQHTLAQRISIDHPASAIPPREADMRRVEPAYFATMAVRLVAGRAFTESDRDGTQGVAIVNETMARMCWGGASALGKRLAFEQGSGGAPAWLEVVGVVSDTRDATLMTAPPPQFFIPLLQNSNGLSLDSLTIFVRTAGDPLTMADLVRARIWSIDPRQPIAEISTVEVAVERFLAAPRFRTMLLAILAAVGLLLALLGIYAVLAYSVNQRTSEMAIRLALGADAREIVRLVLTHAMLLAAAGASLGLGGSVIASRFLRSLLYEVGPLDPPTLAGVSLLLVVTALLACYPVALRAARTDVNTILRGG